MSRRVSRGLSDRPVGEKDALHFLNRELVPVVRELLRVIQSGPARFDWLSGAASVDVSQTPDYVAGGLLTQDSALTLINGFDGAQGTITVQQDATGMWDLSFAADGRTVVTDDPLGDLSPNPNPLSLTLYNYLLLTVAGTQYLYLGKRDLV